MKNKILAIMLIVLATLSIFVLAPRSSFMLFVSFFAGGLGAGVGAGIVSARPPSPVWKSAVICLSAAFAPWVVLLLRGFPPAYALGYGLLPTVLYGTAAIFFARGPLPVFHVTPRAAR